MKNFHEKELIYFKKDLIFIFFRDTIYSHSISNEQDTVLVLHPWKRALDGGNSAGRK